MKNISEIEFKALKKLYAVLSELGYDFSEFLATDKNSRVIFQKLVYALQKNGFQLGYNYNLYINGPYSPGLASDGYIIAENIHLFANSTEPFSLSSTGKAKVENTREYLDHDTNNRNWLETLATIDYLYTSFWGASRNKDTVIARFREIKPQLDDAAMIEKAWAKVSKA